MYIKQLLAISLLMPFMTVPSLALTESTPYQSTHMYLGGPRAEPHGMKGVFYTAAAQKGLSDQSSVGQRCRHLYNGGPKGTEPHKC
jgi:hypothetical protein